MGVNLTETEEAVAANAATCATCRKRNFALSSARSDLDGVARRAARKPEDARLREMVEVATAELDKDRQAAIDHLSEDACTRPAATCKVEDCDTAPRSRGWCDTHYRRVLRYGSTEPRREPGPETCTVDGCDRPHNARGYCATHYKRALRTEWAEGRMKAESTRQIRPMGDDLSVEPLVAYLDSLGGLAEATAWMGTIKSTAVERWKRNIERAKVRGYMDAAVADEFCCRVLRIHPFFVWGEIWWDHEETEQAAA